MDPLFQNVVKSIISVSFPKKVRKHFKRLKGLKISVIQHVLW